MSNLGRRSAEAELGRGGGRILYNFDPPTTPEEIEAAVVRTREGEREKARAWGARRRLAAPAS